MNDRRLAAESRRLELAAQIDVQRFRLGLQMRLLASNRPWLGLVSGQAWRRNLLIAGIVAVGGATLLVRSRVATSAAAALALAKVGARCWVAGKLGWELARRWRLAQGRPTVNQGTSS
jgi:hypothetical protein